MAKKEQYGSNKDHKKQPQHMKNKPAFSQEEQKPFNEKQKEQWDNKQKDQSQRRK